jgi:hypothetical protein
MPIGLIRINAPFDWLSDFAARPSARAVMPARVVPPMSNGRTAPTAHSLTDRIGIEPALRDERAGQRQCHLAVVGRLPGDQVPGAAVSQQGDAIR